MDVVEILEAWLKENNYKGLSFMGECSCDIGDLVPCSDVQPECYAYTEEQT